MFAHEHYSSVLYLQQILHVCKQQQMASGNTLR